MYYLLQSQLKDIRSQDGEAVHTALPTAFVPQNVWVSAAKTAFACLHFAALYLGPAAALVLQCCGRAVQADSVGVEGSASRKVGFSLENRVLSSPCAFVDNHFVG